MHSFQAALHSDKNINKKIVIRNGVFLDLKEVDNVMPNIQMLSTTSTLKKQENIEKEHSAKDGFKINTDEFTKSTKYLQTNQSQYITFKKVFASKYFMTTSDDTKSSGTGQTRNELTAVTKSLKDTINGMHLYIVSNNCYIDCIL